MSQSEESPYQDDALMMSSDTEVDEVQRFIKSRVRNPYAVGGKLVWNFNNHKPDMEALEFAAKNKLQNSRYVIPFQVTGTWGFMMKMLPEELQRAEVLVFKPEFGDYAAYDNLSAHLEESELQEFKKGLRDDLRSLGSTSE